MQVPAEAEAFCERMRPRLVGALSLFTGSHDVAEELAQETLVRALLHWRTLQAHPAPDRWALRVGFNLARSVFRRRLAERRANALAAARPQPTPSDPGDGEDGLTEAVRRLPSRQRSAVVLRYYADLSVRDTAAVLGCAPGTVKALCAQAVSNLRGLEQLYAIPEVPDA